MCDEKSRYRLFRLLQLGVWANGRLGRFQRNEAGQEQKNPLVRSPQTGLTDIPS